MSAQEVEQLERQAYVAAVNSGLLLPISTSSLTEDVEGLRRSAKHSPWVRGVRAAIIDELHARALRDT